LIAELRSVEELVTAFGIRRLSIKVFVLKPGGSFEDNVPLHVLVCVSEAP
jgi:hypothetical protein